MVPHVFLYRTRNISTFHTTTNTKCSALAMACSFRPAHSFYSTELTAEVIGHLVIWSSGHLVVWSSGRRFHMYSNRRLA